MTKLSPGRSKQNKKEGNQMTDTENELSAVAEIPDAEDAESNEAKLAELQANVDMAKLKAEELKAIGVPEAVAKAMDREVILAEKARDNHFSEVNSAELQAISLAINESVKSAVDIALCEKIARLRGKAITTVKGNFRFEVVEAIVDDKPVYSIAWHIGEVAKTVTKRSVGTETGSGGKRGVAIVVDGVEYSTAIECARALLENVPDHGLGRANIIARLKKAGHTVAD